MKKPGKNCKIVSVAEVLGDAAVVILEGYGLEKVMYLKPGSWRCSRLVGDLDNEGAEPPTLSKLRRAWCLSVPSLLWWHFVPGQGHLGTTAA